MRFCMEIPRDQDIPLKASEKDPRVNLSVNNKATTTKTSTETDSNLETDSIVEINSTVETDFQIKMDK